jgi:hypothetical protein
MTEYPDVLTPFPEPDFILLVARTWSKFYGTAPKVEQLACCLAQMVLETGRETRNGVTYWGKSAHCYNWGNIKWSEGKDYCYYPAGEWIMENGQSVWRMFYPPHFQCKFRGYGSADEGTLDYIRFLAIDRERYASAWNEGVLKGNPLTFAKELGLHGYYTAPPSRYAATVVSLFNEFLKKIPPILNSPEAADVYAADKERFQAEVDSGLADLFWARLREEDGDTQPLPEDEATASITPNV